MDSLAARLDAFWISKLGVERLAQLPGGSTGKKPLERALNVVRELPPRDRRQLHELLWEGFDGYFHETVYARNELQKPIAGPIADLPLGASQGPVEWWARQSASAQSIRALAGAKKEIEFLTEAGALVREVVAVPVLVEAVSSRLRVRVLTVQSTPPTWTELTGVAVRRLLTPVVANESADLVLSVLAGLPTQVGTMQDLSAQVVRLMKNTETCFTYSGTYGVRTVGRTRHTSEGGRLGHRRQPLHVVMPSEFRELISAKQVRHCEIEMQRPFEGLPPGTAVVLYPVEGKIVFRKMLGKGIIDEFLAFVAR
jgi:hypothetical protein